MSDALVLKHVTLTREEAVIFDDLNLTVEQGEVRALVGLEINDLISFLQIFENKTPDARGTFEIMGKAARFDRRTPQAEVIYRDVQIFPQMTVYEQIMLDKSSPVYLRKASQMEECQKVLNRFGIDLDVRQPAYALRHEERKLISFLKAYVDDRPVVVILEPYHDINKMNRIRIHSLIRGMKDQGQTVILLTSHLDDAMLLADRISVFDAGTIKMTASAEAVIADPREVMYKLSGWNALKPEEVQKEREVLKSITSSRDILTASQGLEKVLRTLVIDLMRVIDADAGMICLIDTQTNGLLDVVQTPTSVQISRDYLDRITALVLKNDGPVVYQRGGRGTETFFFEDFLYNSLMLMPIRPYRNISGSLVVWFEDYHDLTDSDLRYLQTFANEVGVAIETSKLLGRSLLLQESHHRIKNNLQMIMSMVQMQKSRTSPENEEMIKALDAIISRTQSMAIVHDHMAKDNPDASIVSLAAIVEDIAASNAREGVTVDLDIDDISIPYNKATSVSLMLNELICNSVKYAFPEEHDRITAPGSEAEPPRIDVSCKSDGSRMTIVVADNGVGFDEAAISGGLGFSLIRGIVLGMKGTISRSGKNGSRTEITLPVSHVYDAKNSARVTTPLWD